MKRRRFNLPYLCLTIDFGWLGMHTTAMHESYENMSYEYLSLVVWFGKKKQIFKLYSPCWTSK